MQLVASWQGLLARSSSVEHTAGMKEHLQGTEWISHFAQPRWFLFERRTVAISDEQLYKQRTGCVTWKKSSMLQCTVETKLLLCLLTISLCARRWLAAMAVVHAYQNLVLAFLEFKRCTHFPPSSPTRKRFLAKHEQLHASAWLACWSN